MSGVYIKGMEMPKHDDEYVIFTVYGDGGVVYGPLNRPHVRYKDRAVPVPQHGRLIDADALIKELEITEEDDHNGATLLMAVFLEVLKSAPTIIQASGAENSFPAEPSEEQRGYEAAVEATQYCEMYEPSYDPETGAL